MSLGLRLRCPLFVGLGVDDPVGRDGVHQEPRPVAGRGDRNQVPACRARSAQGQGVRHLFVGSDTGGDRAAVLYTLIESAKLNGLNPEAYLADVIDEWPAATEHATRRASALALEDCHGNRPSRRESTSWQPPCRSAYAYAVRCSWASASMTRWDVTVFTKNPDRLLEGEIATKFLRAVLDQPRGQGAVVG